MRVGANSHSSARRRDEVVVAIHQPNFFPWLGYFDKIAHADVFVVLDSVQFPKKQGTWMNRVQILLDGRPHWLTVPVDRAYHGVRTVREMRIADDGKWREKMLKTLRAAYGKAPHFGEVVPMIDELLHVDGPSLADFNITGVNAFVDRLIEHPAELAQSSELAIEGSATDLLVAITRAVGGTAYLCGAGAAGYQDDERFTEEGLELRYQKFAPPSYPQIRTNDRVPGLSVVDALFNLGFEGTSALLTRTEV